MQKRYKITSLMIILAIMISMCSFAVSADTANEQDAETLNSMKETAVERTHALGILSDSDLAFTAGAKTTRAEFCVWAVKMLGMENSTGSFRYSDVPDDYWAAKYINAACSIKLISEDKEFNPDMPIQYSEAVKILVSAAGYEMAASQNGGWPSGYLVIASKIGILKGISNKDGSVTRLDAVKMIDNTLDVKIMDTYYNGVYEQTDKTILSEYLKINIISGTISEVDKKNKKIKVDTNGTETWYDLAQGIDAALIVEDEADIYVSDDRYGKKVVYIDFKGTIDVCYDYISEVNESANDTLYSKDDIKKIYLKNADKAFNMDSDSVITLNDARLDDISASLVGTFAKVVMRNDKVYKIEAYTLYEGGVLNRADKEKIKYIHGEVNDNAMEGLDKVDDFQIYLDGVPTTDIYSLKRNYVFDYYINADESKLILVVSSRVYTAELSGTMEDCLILNGKRFETDPGYGLYVYSNTRERYQKDASLSTYMGKTVTAMVDDNMRVRYIKITDDIENINTFYGVVLGASADNNPFGDDDAKIKVYKITGGEGEKIYNIDSDRMEKSPIKMDYIREVAGDTEGKNFLKFTLNKEDKISKVEEIDLWGNKFKFSSTISKDNVGWVGNLSAITATLFTVFKEDGECKVKTLNFEKNLRDTVFPGGVTVVSDYDPMYNPKPDFVMFGTGSENHRTSGSQSGFVKSVEFVEDDKVELRFLQPYGTDRYTVTQEFYEQNADALKKNNYIEWYYEKFTEDPIEVRSYKDLSGDTSTWPNDNAGYTSGTTSGFYKADKIMYRDGSSIQFMINGEPSDLIPLNQYYVIYELKHTKDGNSIVKKTGNNVLGYINSNDNVWVSIVPWGPEPRSALMVIYEKNSITGN